MQGHDIQITSHSGLLEFSSTINVSAAWNIPNDRFDTLGQNSIFSL